MTEKNRKKITENRKILMCGNEAVGEAAIVAGCKFYAGYPITPQNELTAYMSRRMPEEGRTFIQSESELAAINMVFGASAAGARAMTSSSSPGISLKQEGISYMAGAELPGVIINMMRAGPGLGNITPAQGDYFQATKGGGHGDYHIIVLAPASVQELFNLGIKAFDLADKYRTPVMVMGDGMLGQMMEPIEFQKTENRRQKTENKKNLSSDFYHQTFDKPWALTGCKGRKANVVKSLYLKEGALEDLNNRLQEKYKKISEEEVLFEEYNTEEADMVLVSYGTVSRICKSAAKKLISEEFKVGFLRPITLWPFPYKKINQLAKAGKKFFVVEMSSGQMLEDVILAVNGKSKVNFYGRMGGGIPEESVVFAKVKELLNAKNL